MLIHGFEGISRYSIQFRQFVIIQLCYFLCAFTPKGGLIQFHHHSMLLYSLYHLRVYGTVVIIDMLKVGSK